MHHRGRKGPKPWLFALPSRLRTAALVLPTHSSDWEELSETALDFPAGPNHDRERFMIIYGLSRDKSRNGPGKISNCFRLWIACTNVSPSEFSLTLPVRGDSHHLMLVWPKGPENPLLASLDIQVRCGVPPRSGG